MIESSLNFKDQLFDFQDNLRMNALKNKVTMPETFGFKDYVLAVPEPEKLDLLSRELFAVENIATVLIDSKVKEIVNISLEHEYSKESPRIFPVEVSFIGSFNSIQKFLNNLAEQDSIYIAKNISIEKTKGNLLVTTVSLEYSDI